MAYVFDFDHAHRRPPMEMKDLLGGKGANLAEMTSVLHLPVPPGFTISTDACRAHMESGWPEGLTEELAKARSRLERSMGKVVGDPSDPLLVSVRSGAKFSMPGMMDTVLNLGLNDKSVEGLAKQTGDERFAYDSYRRFLAMYGRIVLDIPGQEFDSLFEAAKELAGTSSDAKVPTELLRYLADSYQQVVERNTGQPFPQDPADQLRGAIEAVFRSWNGPRAIAYREREQIPHTLGTAVNVQAMVFGNRDDQSGTGVGFTRDPATGDRGAYGDFLVNAQGEDVVAGIRNTEPLSALKSSFPKVHKELLVDLRPARAALPRHVRHRVHHRAGQALDAPDPGGQAHRTGRPQDGRRHDDRAGHPAHPGRGRRPDHRGPPRLGAPPPVRRQRPPGAGAGAGRLAGGGGGPGLLHRRRRRRRRRAGRAGGAGAQRDLARGRPRHAGRRGDPDRPGRPGEPCRGGGPGLGQAGRGRGRGPAHRPPPPLGGGRGGGRGGVALARRHLGHRGRWGRWISSRPTRPPEFETLLSWADEIRKGHLGVRANADNGEDAANARRLGAEGIGLCRTEHMFLGEDRLPVVRRMILADRPEEEHDALEQLRRVQREDFVEILEAMDGLPVTVRLLDPPLHEFLPSTHELAVQARRPWASPRRSSTSTTRRGCGRRPTPCSAPGASASA